MLNFEETRRYWEDRAAGDSGPQSTTQDFYLREIEFGVLFERIRKKSPKLVADIGCGDGRTTARLASQLPHSSFSGLDYSSFMIENANRILVPNKPPNVEFGQLNICEGLIGSFNLIYTTRCLINLPSWTLQKVAIDNIYKALTAGGAYLMVENFVEGQDNFNHVRKEFGLPDIPIREHNLYFERDRLLDYVNGRFEVEEEVNISSVYYLVSRVVYSKICSETGKEPDYFDAHHRLAAALPFAGEFGPVRLICLNKK